MYWYCNLIFTIIIVILCIVLTTKYKKYRKNHNDLLTYIRFVAQKDVDNELILRWLQTTLVYYKQHPDVVGLCIALCKAFPKSKEYENLCYRYTNSEYLHVSCIRDIIPEFKPTYFGLEEKSEYEYWWEVNDIQSRINALTELIDLYDKKINYDMLGIVKKINRIETLLKH